MAALIVNFMWPANHRMAGPKYDNLPAPRKRVEDAKFCIYGLAEMVMKNKCNPIVLVESKENTMTVDANFPTQEVIVTKRKNMKITSVERFSYTTVGVKEVDEIEDVYLKFFWEGTYCNNRGFDNDYEKVKRQHTNLLCLMRAWDADQARKN